MAAPLPRPPHPPNVSPDPVCADRAMREDVICASNKMAALLNPGQPDPIPQLFRLYSSLRTSEESRACGSCATGWVSFGCNDCCKCCTKRQCVYCTFHVHAARWETLHRDGETSEMYSQRAKLMKTALITATRKASPAIDSAAFRASVLRIGTPTRKRDSGPSETLPAMVLPFEPTVSELVTAALRSLSSRTVAPRVVEIPGTSNTRAFGVAPICLVPSHLVKQYQTVCEKAPRGRHRILRTLSVVTKQTIAQPGDLFAFNDDDPGAGHTCMAPSLVLQRTVTSKVR